jgi:hypothetical protein
MRVIGGVTTIVLDGPDVDLSELTVNQLSRLYVAMVAEIQRRGERWRKADQQGTARTHRKPISDRGL